MISVPKFSCRLLIASVALAIISLLIEAGQQPVAAAETKVEKTKRHAKKSSSVKKFKSIRAGILRLRKPRVRYCPGEPGCP